MEYNNILTSEEEGILTITINRPDKLNALNSSTIRELSDAFSIADKNEKIRVLIITGSGDKAFVAGADIAEFYKFQVQEGKELSEKGHETLFNLIENLSKPAIAAINGFALGGGLELAMSCHIRLASENAKMGLPEVSLGVIPGYGGTQRLPQLAGKGKAFEMILTAGMISAEEAYHCGLVNHVTERDKLMERCREIAGKIMKNSPLAIAAAIRSVNSGYKKGINGFDVEIDEFGGLFGTEDFREGTNAFIEKRKPHFPGK